MGDIGTSSVSLAILCNYSSGVSQFFFEFQGFWNMRIISQTSRPKNGRLRHSGWSLAISLGIVWRQRTFGTNWRYDVDFFVRNTSS